MFEVGQDEFLVLLFMLQAKFDGRQEKLHPPVARGQDRLHAFINRATIIVNFRHAGTRQQAPFGTRILNPNLIIVGIEQVGEIVVPRGIAGASLRQDEGLEKPSGMGQVPAGRAGIRHGLDDVILNCQRRTKRFGLLAYILIAFTHRLPMD